MTLRNETCLRPFDALCATCGTEIEKSEFAAQISLSQIRLFSVCAVKIFMDRNTKLDHAELLSVSII